MSPSPDVEPAPPTRPLRIREAVRAVVLDPHDRVLLVRFEFPNASRWALPGGGLEPGEQHDEALQRELAEELGLVDATIGPLCGTACTSSPSSTTASTVSTR